MFDISITSSRSRSSAPAPRGALLIRLTAGLLFALHVGARSLAAGPSNPLPFIDLAGKPATEVNAFLAEQTRDGSWWVRVGDLVYGPDVAGPERAVGVDRDIARYYATSCVELPFDDLKAARVGGDFGIHILHFPAGRPADLAARPLERHCGEFTGQLTPLPRNGALLERWSAGEIAESDRAINWGIQDVTVEAFLDQLDQERYFQDVVDLAEFVNRNTYSASNDLARAWLVERFKAASPALQVSEFLFDMTGGNTTGNVVAYLPGTTSGDEFIVVGGHYDSQPAESPSAPGAEDNASGTAGVLEIARIVAAAGPQQRSIYFVAFGAEEQGLIGSYIWANDVVNPMREQFRGALIMDMIAYRRLPQQTNANVRLVTNGAYGAELSAFLAATASRFTSLTIFTQSSLTSNSDHGPFLGLGLPAVLSIENDYATYSAYHMPWDTPELLTPSQGAEIVRLNLAALLRLANPLPPPAANASGLAAR